MVHDVNKNETTHADTARTVSHGVKSLIVLGLLGSVSAVLGVVSIGPDSESGGISAAHASPVPPPLAATLLSATEFEPVLGAPTQTSDTLKRRETLTELVTRLGAEPSDAAAALHTIDLPGARFRPGRAGAHHRAWYRRLGKRQRETWQARPDRSQSRASSPIGRVCEAP